MKTSAIILSLLCCSFTLHAADWPQWRGPNRDGHPAGSPTVSSLPKELKPVWKNAIGPGFSSPIISGGKLIYLDAQRASDGENTNEVAHCLDAATGKEVWNKTYASGEGDEWGVGPRTTPFVDGDRIYFQSMNGEFRCLSLADGKSLWVSMEGPLLQDGPMATMADGAWARLSRHDRTDDGGFGPLALQVAYRIAPIPATGA